MPSYPPNRYQRPEKDEARIRRTAKRKLISAELEDFLRYLNSPWQIVWRNLLVGLTRGLGAVFGATVVVGLAIWVLKIFVDLPLIGDYARDFRDRVSEVAEETRYTCLLYTSPSPRDATLSRMPSSA